MGGGAWAAVARVVSISIAPATLADANEVSAIEESVFADPWSANSFRSLPGDPRVYFACAKAPANGAGADSAKVGAAGGVVGYVVAIFAADEGEIANLAVASDARGRGIGAGLLDAALRHAKERGANALYLEVRESNSAARHLYGARGFKEVGRRRGYYQRPVEDALILRRLVGPGLK